MVLAIVNQVHALVVPIYLFHPCPSDTCPVSIAQCPYTYLPRAIAQATPVAYLEEVAYAYFNEATEEVVIRVCWRKTLATR